MHRPVLIHLKFRFDGVDGNVSDHFCLGEIRTKFVHCILEGLVKKTRVEHGLDSRHDIKVRASTANDTEMPLSPFMKGAKPSQT